MSRGFIDRIGGNLRFRWVKPGFDARDFSTPANAVIFDSEANAFLQVFLSGSFQINDGNSGEYKAVTWPSLGYVPFAWAAWGKNGWTRAPVPSAWHPNYPWQGGIFIEPNGLRVESRGLIYPVTVDYVVWRVPAI